MWRKRAVFILAACIVLLSVLLGRLAQIQLLQTENFTENGINLLEASVQQRSQEMILDTGRGNFVDRHGDPLTHTYKPVLILFPFLANMDWNVKQVSDITGASEYALRYAVEQAKEPIAFGSPKPLELTSVQMQQINELQIPGVFAVDKKYHLLDNPAEQLIGITSMNKEVVQQRYPDKQLSEDTMVGVTGMEKSFDEFLLPEGNSKLVYHVDAIGGPLFGIDVKYVEPANPYYPVNIRTTLDHDIQAIAEEVTDKHEIQRGGLVLIDIETNSVLASVSRPSINKSNPFEEETGGTENLMVKQQIMGSVFKTVVAAAAIDYQLADSSRLFDCSKTITGEPDMNYDHGMLNFNDSFARSCNITFATLAKELKEIDPHILEEYAEKLSLTGGVGWHGDIYHFEDFHQLQDEDEGRVFLSDDARKDSNFVGLTGIGQHEVRATPLAVANMMAAIARGGKKEMVRVASGVEYKNHTSLLEFKEKPIAGDNLSPYTAINMQKLLREVVLDEEGTGRWFQNLPYAVAGKSGTAQTGAMSGEVELHNKWFAGYFPYDQPKYALVTVNLDVPADSGGVNPLFAEMVEKLYEYDQESS
ncbi:peptidoglycan D,D-transpeptidase FtsI family protein [Cytobacillus gottheilii]|uniref:peptidoglycan D,D-transpeptidase FtsI family protein n=1 Tax=Cytobacillus gottheilii TaxID=859144 RepID=UPI0009BBA9FF|nr:penicillin-binding transpeptidase domain-containing protein [Cytobacillus gottheilii]